MWLYPKGGQLFKIQFSSSSAFVTTVLYQPLIKSRSLSPESFKAQLTLKRRSRWNKIQMQFLYSVANCHFSIVWQFVPLYIWMFCLMLCKPPGGSSNLWDLVSVLNGQDDSLLPASYSKGVMHMKHLLKFKTVCMSDSLVKREKYHVDVFPTVKVRKPTQSPKQQGFTF